MNTSLEIPKIPKYFECKICEYITTNKKDYKKHILTLKHSKLTNHNTVSLHLFSFQTPILK